MAPTSDDSPVDTNIDMVIEEAPSTSSRPRASNAPSPIESHPLSLKFEFRCEKADFAARNVHRELMFAIANNCPGTVFHHNDNTSISSFDPFIASDDEMDTKYKYKIFKRSNYFLACFAHSIDTQATFDDIKKHCKPILNNNNGFIRIHKWNEGDLDIATAGWLFESNPTVHNRDYIHKIIQTYCRSLDVTYHHIEIVNKTISFTNRITKTKVSAPAIHILCRRDDIKTVQNMLQTLYSNPIFDGPGKFIPIDLTTKQTTMALEKLITLQKSYLSNHRSITVAGVSFESLAQLIDDKECSTLTKLINKCVLIDWVTPTTKTETNGRIIFSTTAQNYFAAIEWVEDTFLPLHKSIHHRINPTAFEGHAHRIARKGQTDRVADVYTANLMKTINSLPVSTAPSSNAWNKPLVIGQTDPVQPLNHNITANNNQQSTINDLNSKIDSLSQTIDKLQQQIAQQLEQQTTLITTITTIVEEQVAKRFHNIHENIKAVEAKYISIIDQINSSWSNKLDRIRNDKSLITNSTNEPPGSGSNRARKQPRTTDDLEEVQRNLFQHTDPSSNNSTDINMNDESVV